MAYIGRDTDKLSNIEVLDTITFDGSTSYTLQKNSVNFTPSSANNVLVSIDGVVQANNFTVSGSTIDFGVAVPSTSTCDWIYHIGVGLITTPADGTVTTAKLADSSVSLAKLTATGTKDATTFLRGDNTFASVGLSYFQARLASSQTSITSNTATKVAYDTEDYDTASSFDLSTDRFTPANSTVWLLQADIVAGRSNDTEAGEIYLYKNGSSLLSRIFFADPAGSVSANQMGGTIQFIVTGNGSDYYEIYGRADLGNDADTATFYSSNFTGIRLS